MINMWLVFDLIISLISYDIIVNTIVKSVLALGNNCNL